MLRHDFLQTITVIVGEHKAQFVVHTNHICKSSGFFRAAVKGEWKEAIDRIVTLPEAKSEAFDTYLGWLYTGHVTVLESRKHKYGETFSKTKLKKAHRDLIDAYCLGDYLEDSHFRTAVVDEVKHAIEESNYFVLDANVFYLWEHVRHDSQLARMMIDYIAADLNVKPFEKYVSTFPATFVMEIAKICVREYNMAYKDRKPRNRPKCYYHEHKGKKDQCKEVPKEEEGRKGCAEEASEEETSGEETS